jgi:uncharacterized protein YkwD
MSICADSTAGPWPRARHSRLLACALAAALLAGCGGGGGDGSSASVTAASGAEPVPLAVPAGLQAASYASTDARNTLYQQLNAVRVGAGAGMVQQNVLLDQAATAHLSYLALNGSSAGHTELAGRPGFTGTSPANRVSATGYQWSLVGEDLAWGTGFTPLQCLDMLLATVYHLAGLLGDQREVGVGFGNAGSGLSGCIFDFAVPQGGSLQPPAAGVLLRYPFAGQTGVATTFRPASESPNPMPDVGNASVGQPVYVSMRNQGSNDAAGYSFDSFTLRDAIGALPARIIVNGTTGPDKGLPGDARLKAGELFLVPLVPLESGKTYTVSFKGHNGSVAYNQAWNFTTR